MFPDMNAVEHTRLNKQDFTIFVDTNKRNTIKKCLHSYLQPHHKDFPKALLKDEYLYMFVIFVFLVLI